jgi:hypothetical protein
MLFESTPAWIALFVAAAATLTPSHAGPVGVLRRLTIWSVGIAIITGLTLGLDTARESTRSALRVDAPEPPEDNAIVFVHGSWASRIAARLAAAGMRRDSIDTVLRRNDVCAVDRYARWRTAPGKPGAAPPLDMESRSGSPSTLESQALSVGNLVRVLPGFERDAACIREARSDRLGVLELELLAWRFPHIPNAGTVVVRDLGPAANLPILQALAKPAYVYIDTGSDDGVLLLDYSDGMELLWGGAAGEGVGGEGVESGQRPTSAAIGPGESSHLPRGRISRSTEPSYRTQRLGQNEHRALLEGETFTESNAHDLTDYEGVGRHPKVHLTPNLTLQDGGALHDIWSVHPSRTHS